MKIFKIKNHNGTVSTITIKIDTHNPNYVWLRIDGRVLHHFGSMIEAENYVRANYNVI